MPNNLYCIHVPPEDDIGILFTKAKIMTVLISAVYGAAGNSWDAGDIVDILTFNPLFHVSAYCFHISSNLVEPRGSQPMVYNPICHLLLFQIAGSGAWLKSI
jgi:hypothetical protein